MIGNNQKTKIVEIVEDGKPPRWTVTTGSAVVKIYFTPNDSQDFYTVSRWVDGKRKRELFSTLEAAKAEATKISKGIAGGNAGNSMLTSAERASFLRAMQLLEPIGVPLEVAVSEYVELFKKVNGRAPISVVGDFYVKRNQGAMEPKMVKEVITECLESKRQDNLSDRYIKQLEYNLERFSTRFHNRIADVSGVDIDAWLRSLKATGTHESKDDKTKKAISGRTRNNLRASVQVLFSYAKAKRYVAKDHDELDAVPAARNLGGEIGIFRPGEMMEILAAAAPEWIPFLVLGAFAGVRHAEIQRLDWQDIKFKAGIIEIRASNAKTASRRTIPILPNVQLWLKELIKESGPVCPYLNMTEQLKDLKNRINAIRVEKELEGDFEWQHNGLRHSFISYRVAQVQNVAQTALEAGNSPAIIFRNYRELVTPQDAAEWFDIVPSKVDRSKAVKKVEMIKVEAKAERP